MAVLAVTLVSVVPVVWAVRVVPVLMPPVVVAAVKVVSAGSRVLVRAVWSVSMARRGRVMVARVVLVVPVWVLLVVPVVPVVPVLAGRRVLSAPRGGPPLVVVVVPVVPVVPGGMPRG